MDIVMCLVIYALLHTEVSAVTFPQCINQAIELTEGVSGQAIRCDGTGSSGQVIWYNKGNDSFNVYTECREVNINCTNPGDLFKAVRNETSSTLTMIRIALRVYGIFEWKCQWATEFVECPLDIVSHPIVTCLAQYNTDDPQWTVSGSCTITHALSTRHRYSCLWFYKHNNNGVVQIPLNQTTRSSVSLTPGSNPTLPYYNFTCSFNMPLPTEAGNYGYSAAVYPGALNASANFVGNSSVDAPSSAPDISCNHSGTQREYIKENTDLTCTCSASYLGQPQGRLVGYNGTKRLNAGNYGDSSFILDPQRISRGDNGTSFTCVLDWATSDSDKESVKYTVAVAYGPDNVTLSGPAVFDLNPAVSSYLNVTCNTSLFNPGVTYIWSRSCDGGTSGSTCTFKPNISDNNKVMNCSVTNTAAQVTRISSWTIALNYPPNVAPTIANYNNGDILYSGDNLTLVCTVNGGEPLVTSVNFSCDGRQDGNDVSVQDGVSSSVTFTPLMADDHGVNCTCKAEWKNRGWYTLTANRSLTVYHSTDRTKLYLNGRSHNVTMNETDSVVMTCQANGRPTPTMHLLYGNGELKMSNIGLPTDDLDSMLKFSLNGVQCHHAGKYVCTAGNNISHILTDEASLFVNCKPRRNSSASTPEANFQGNPEKLSFDVIAYPAPDTFSFTYGGTDLNVAGNATAVRENMLTIRCLPANIVYLATCNITVENMTEADAGNYYVTVANTFGQVEIRFRLLFNETIITVLETQKQDPPYGAIAGGVVAAVVVATGLVVLVVFVQRKRAGINKSTARPQIKNSGKITEITKENDHERGHKDDDDVVMIDNDLYGRTGKAATVPTFSAAQQKSAYEDVEMPAVCPAVQSHTPAKGANLCAAGQKQNHAQTDTTYASVNKNSSTSSSTWKPKVKPKPAKVSEQLLQKTKKEKLTNTENKAGVYGNMPLSMKPMTTEYENFAFQSESSENTANNAEEKSSEGTTKDGLVYTTIQFSDSQQKKSSDPPPAREKTEYASLSFDQHASPN